MTANGSRPRVGLLSIPRFYNYGTQLQLFGAKAAIEEAGYDCEVIDYVKHFVDPPRVGNPLEIMLWRASRLVAGPSERAYERYVGHRGRTWRALSRRYEDETLAIRGRRYVEPADFSAHPPTHDAFVVGSDQLWSPLGHLGDTAFFLKFAPPEKRIAYAPSLGVEDLDAEASEWIRSGVDGLRHLSVREDTGADLVEAVSGRRPRVVVDPTMLHSAERWASEARSSSYVEGDYVLQYTLAGDPYIRRRRDAVARALGCRRVVLPKHWRDVLSIRPDVVKAWDVGPREFLELFRRARLILTDSFHGTLFAVRFGRPFYSFRRYHGLPSRFSRIRDFLVRVGLEDRITDRHSGALDPEPAIDFAPAHRRLDDWVDESRTFLHDALREATAGARHPPPDR